MADNLTFVIELEEPCTYFTDLLTNNNFTPCNEDFFHSVGDKYGTSYDTVLSCGPYILDRYEPLATQIHFKKNPYYYDSENIKLDGVNLQVIGNAQQALMCYEAGTVDILSVEGELLELTDTDPELHVFTSASLYYFYVNQTKEREELRNKNIRIAISKSLDRQDLVDNLLRSGFAPMTRIIPPGFYTETDGTDFAADSGLYDEYAAYDPDSAVKHWQQGLAELGVTSLEFELVCNSDQVAVAEVLVDQMERTLPGLKIRIKAVPFKERVALRGRGEYELMISGWYADYSDPTSFLALFITGANANSYNNPEYDSLYNLSCSAEYAKDPDGRNAILHRVEDLLMEDAGTIPIYTTGNTYLIRSNVTGFQIPPTGTGVIITGLEKEVR